MWYPFSVVDFFLQTSKKRDVFAATIYACGAAGLCSVHTWTPSIDGPSGTAVAIGRRGACVGLSHLGWQLFLFRCSQLFQPLHLLLQSAPGAKARQTNIDTNVNAKKKIIPARLVNAYLVSYALARGGDPTIVEATRAYN